MRRKGKNIPFLEQNKKKKKLIGNKKRRKRVVDQKLKKQTNEQIFLSHSDLRKESDERGYNSTTLP